MELYTKKEVKFVKSRLRTKDEFKGIKRGQRSKLNMLVFPMSAEGKSRLMENQTIYEEV